MNTEDNKLHDDYVNKIISEQIANSDFSPISKAIDKDIIENIQALADQKIISDNLIFLEWYFRGDSNMQDDREKQRVFSFLTYSILEDPYCFLRIVLYIANTRHTDKQEIFYKTIIHFLGAMFPEIIMANLDLFINCGKKDDVLYFMQCQGITERVITWIKHKAREDQDFAILLNGKLIGKPINRTIYYKPKFSKNFKWSVFLTKILDEPFFNGITIGTAIQDVNFEEQYLD